MAMKLKDRHKITKVVTVEYDGEAVDVTYRPAMITNQTNVDARTSDANSFNAEWISRVVAEWDVIDEDGSKFAPTVDNARRMESLFLQAVIVAIYGDMRPNGTSGNGSFGG